MTVRCSDFASFTLTIRCAFAKTSSEEEMIPVTPANRTYLRREAAMRGGCAEQGAQAFADFFST
jgi:hypothetical protein